MNIREIFAKPRQLPLPLASVTPRPAPAPAVRREAVPVRPPDSGLCWSSPKGWHLRHNWKVGGICAQCGEVLNKILKP